MTINVLINNVAENKATSPDQLLQSMLLNNYIEQMNNRDTVDGSKNTRDLLELLCQTAVFKQILITSKTKQAVSRSFYKWTQLPHSGQWTQLPHTGQWTQLPHTGQWTQIQHLVQVSKTLARGYKSTCKVCQVTKSMTQTGLLHK